MKRTLTVICTLLLAAVSFAQNYNVREEVLGDLRKAAGMEGPYRFDAPAPTPCPKGYKPFYISHYGRHGSRYSWTSMTYTELHRYLTDAREAGMLTPYGQDFCERFENFYEIPLINAGDLVPLGWEQHKRIAAIMYDEFPQVFAKGGKIEAVVSTAPRSIVSMSSFCLSLKEKNPDLEFYQSSTHAGMLVAAPSSAPEQLKPVAKKMSPMPELESESDFFHRTVDYDGILGKIFSDPAFLDAYEDGRTRFVYYLNMLIGGYHNHESEPIFDDLLSPEQYYGLWEAHNYGSYLVDLNARYENVPLLQDIIAKADLAIEGTNGKVADLRFGHDYVIEAFMALINANGCGTVVTKADDVKYWFQSYNIPMAANAQFVFYRPKKKGGEILFKLMWNGAEATLPQLKPVSGPYYSWQEFKDWCASI